MTIDFKALAAPFPPEEVSWRLGSVSKEKMRGMALAYLDARNVMDRLDEVCGPDGWQCRYSHVGPMTVCEIGVRSFLPICDGVQTKEALMAEWIWKADGAGQSDIEAEKGAMSDAFKRAGVRWGIGRYLYTLDTPWVEIEPTRPGGDKFMIRKGAYKELDMILRRFNQSILNPVAKTPDFIAQARDDIAAMQNAGEQKVVPLKSDARKAAEKFFEEASGTLQHLQGTAINDWLREPRSPKGNVTNRDMVVRMGEKFPDLHDRLQVIMEEVRLRGGALLQ